MNIGTWTLDLVTDLSFTQHLIIEKDGDFFCVNDMASFTESRPVDTWNPSNKWMKINLKYLNGL